MEEKMNNGETMSEQTNVEETKEEAKEEKAEKTFTQSQVNIMMTKEKKQGRNSVLKELGISPDDEKAIANLKNLIASQKTEEQLRAEKEKENIKALEEMETRVKLAEAKSEAMMSGIKPQYVEDAVTLAFSKMGEDGEMKSVLAEFKTKYPMWFTAEEDENNIGQKGTGSTIKGGEKTTSSTKSIGARLASQNQKTNSNKKSYWA